MTPLLSSTLLRAQTDERLVELAASGHDRAFEAIVERYRRPLQRYLRRLLSDTLAEDVIQATFINAWSSLRTGTEVRELRPWLYRIAHNAAINALKKVGEAMEEVPESIGGFATEPAAELERRDEMHRALTSIANLPSRQRAALLAVAVDGRAHSEVAEELGLTDGAVRQLVHRARTTLRGGVTAVTPLPLLHALMTSAGDSTVARVAEVAAGAGGAGAASLSLKAGAAAVLATGALVTGGPEIAHVVRPAEKPVTSEAKVAATTTTAAAAPASAAAATPTAAAIAPAAQPARRVSGSASSTSGRTHRRGHGSSGSRSGHGHGGSGKASDDHGNGSGSGSTRGSSGSGRGGGNEGSGGGHDGSGDGSSGESGSRHGSDSGSGSGSSGRSGASSGSRSRGGSGSGSGSGGDGSGHSGSSSPGSSGSGSGSNASGSSSSGSGGHGKSATRKARTTHVKKKPAAKRHSGSGEGGKDGAKPAPAPTTPEGGGHTESTPAATTPTTPTTPPTPAETTGETRTAPSGGGEGGGGSG